MALPYAVYAYPSVRESLLHLALVGGDAVIGDDSLSAQALAELLLAVTRHAPNVPVIFAGEIRQKGCQVVARHASLFACLTRPLNALLLREMVHNAVARARQARLQNWAIDAHHTAEGVSVVATDFRPSSHLPRPASAPPLAALTDRERSVLELLMIGEANKGIAIALCCSVRTVEFHVRNILRKTGHQSRIDLILRFQTGGTTPLATRASTSYS